jgi:hypothetical protein
MRVWKRLPLVLITLLFLVASETVAAAPLPPELAVNHETKECAEFWGGDECVRCSVPEGWEILGQTYEAECPADYDMVEITPECWAAKEPFCCTEGHSGLAGDCDDVVINRPARQCAFVEDIDDCPALPLGWGRHGEDCPYHDWAADVECLDRGGPGSDGGFGSIGVYEVIIVSLVCGLFCMLPLGAAIVLLALWLLRRRRGQSTESVEA